MPWEPSTPRRRGGRGTWSWLQRSPAPATSPTHAQVAWGVTGVTHSPRRLGIAWQGFALGCSVPQQHLHPWVGLSLGFPGMSGRDRNVLCGAASGAEGQAAGSSWGTAGAESWSCLSHSPTEHPLAGRRGGLAGINCKVSHYGAEQLRSPAGQCWTPAAAGGNQKNGVTEPLPAVLSPHFTSTISFHHAELWRAVSGDE